MTLFHAGLLMFLKITRLAVVVVMGFNPSNQLGGRGRQISMSPRLSCL